MTLDKFALVFDTAVRKISARYGTHPLGHHELGILVLLKRRVSLRFNQVRSLVGKYGKSEDASYVANSLRALIDCGLVSKDGVQYGITTMGREYLSALRSYLRNYRL